MFRYFIVFLLFAFFSFPVLAQNIEKQQDIELVYQKEWRAGIKAHTLGYGLCMSKAKIVDRRTRKVWFFDIQEIKHIKQVKKTGPDTRVYFYGKDNNFYNLNVSYGKQKTLAEKGRKSGVEVGYQYSGGLSIGLLKPYYLQLGKARDGLTDERYDPTEEPSRFLTESQIQGASGFLYGLDETKLLPGLIGHFGFTFDWASRSESIKTLETGLMVNVYPKRVPLMINVPNNFFFVNLYAKLLIGRRWLDN